MTITSVADAIRILVDFHADHPIIRNRAPQNRDSAHRMLSTRILDDIRDGIDDPYRTDDRAIAARLLNASPAPMVMLALQNQIDAAINAMLP